MHTKKTISPKVLVFSRWTRKSYALFSIIGKQVKIGRLSVDICKQSLKTEGSRILQLLAAERNGSLDERETDSDKLSEIILPILQGLFVKIMLITVVSKSTCDAFIVSYFYKEQHKPTSVIQTVVGFFYTQNLW